MADTMTKQAFVETISSLPGVGEAKAEALWEAGYQSIEDVRAASAEELADKVAGVGPKLAEAIVAGVAELEAGAAESEIEVVESLETGADEDAAEIVEQEEHVARPKPKLDDDERAALKLRNWMSAKRHRFVRRNWWQFPKFDKDHPWRRSRGQLAKQRRGYAHTPGRVKVGHRGPAAARGLHPSGFEEVLVHNPGGLDGLDAERQAVRIASGVGRRKRKLIVDAAHEEGLRVLNPGRNP